MQVAYQAANTFIFQCLVFLFSITSMYQGLPHDYKLSLPVSRLGT